jgi:hypothetical protein
MLGAYFSGGNSGSTASNFKLPTPFNPSYHLIGLGYLLKISSFIELCQKRSYSTSIVVEKVINGISFWRVGLPF